VPGLGFLLNNEMDDFTSKPGTANMFGLVQGAANAIEPGKRPLSSMTPTIVFDGERPWIVVGGAGSGRIITGTIQAIVNVVDFGLDAEAAIAAPRIHTQWLPEQLDLEPYIPADVAQGLARRGQPVHPSTASCVLQIITVDKSGGKDAASDPRKHGAPAGY
jgi:gamma-glutamyltranspeptidase/glutathione hydrolase